MTGVGDLFVETCECYDPEDEPCTAEEAFDSLQTTLRRFLMEPLCPPYSGLGGNMVRNGVVTSDSGVYFALKGMQRMHCPAAHRKKADKFGKSKKVKGVPVTFTAFDNVDELKAFCDNGLPWWNNSALEFVTPRRIPYCTTARSKEGIYAGTAECETMCARAHTFCFETSSSPDAVESCLLAKLSEPAFSQNCYIPQILVPGKGIIVCKKRRSDCTLGAWAEWSACTDSCYSSKGARLPLRSRMRRYVHPSSISDAVCSQIQDDDTVEVEECKGLPMCQGEEEVEAVVDNAYNIQLKEEPHLSTWTPTRAPADKSERETRFMSASSCYIADMSKIPASLDRGFDSKYNTCRCPGKASRPCSSTEVLASVSRWASTGNLLCNRDPTLTILAQDMEQFHCALKSFRKIGSQPDCTVQEYALVFCTGEEITSAELSAVWLICLLFGLFAGLACVHFCLQHSSDVQKLLGLSGSYPRLIRELNQLTAKDEDDTGGNAFLDAAAEADIEDTDYATGGEHAGVAYTDRALEETGDCAAHSPWEVGDCTKSTELDAAQQQHEWTGECELADEVGRRDEATVSKGAEKETLSTETERPSNTKAVNFADDCFVFGDEGTYSSTESTAPRKRLGTRLGPHFSRTSTTVRSTRETGHAGGGVAEDVVADLQRALDSAAPEENDEFGKGLKND